MIKIRKSKKAIRGSIHGYRVYAEKSSTGQWMTFLEEHGEQTKGPTSGGELLNRFLFNDLEMDLPDDIGERILRLAAFANGDPVVWHDGK